MSDTALLAAWKAFSRKWTRLQQFGQAQDASTFNGATGCTQTVLQRLVIAWTGKHVTPDEISKAAGYPWPVNNPRRRGMYPSEVQRVVDHYNLPYRYKPNPTWSDIIEALRLGPVTIGIMYGYWPEQVGARYNGQKADGRPGGFALRNGKTQLSGFEAGFHAVLLIGRKRVRGVWRVLANEPNHGSSSRPETPDWDVVKSAHAHRAWDMYASTGRDRFALIPTRTFKPKGF